jgi:linoleoyl-CoA desaturase
MHEASHSGTPHTMVNKVATIFACIFGTAGTRRWVFYHLRHHGITNEEEDPDCALHVALRLRDDLPAYFFHKIQHLYAPFLYMTAGMQFHLDNIVPTPKMYQGRVPIPDARPEDVWPARLWSVIFIVVHFVLPIYVTSSYYNFLVWYTMAAVVSVILVFLLQTNHNTLNLEERTQRHEWGGGVGKTQTIKQDWAIDQIRMSNNFAIDSRFLTHFSGGLNYQIEHHLFPTLNHWSYPRVGAVLRTLCAEKGVPYFAYPTFLAASIDHLALLKLRSVRSSLKQQ